MPQAGPLREAGVGPAGRPASIPARRRSAAPNPRSRLARGSSGGLPHAARQREAWWQRIEELLQRVEGLEAAGGSAEEAVELWLHIAARHPDPAAQADCCRRALSLCPGEPRALEALASLHERGGDWEHAVRLLAKVADAVGSSSRRVELEHRIGRILWQELGDDERAEAHFLHAFALRGGHLPTVRALGEIYRERRDWEAAAEILTRSEARTVRLSFRLELLMEAACIYRDHLHRSRAVDLLESVRAIDPDYLPAVEALADLYCREQSWEEAEPLLEQLELSGSPWVESAAQLRSQPDGGFTAEEEPPTGAWTAEPEDDYELEIVVEMDAAAEAQAELEEVETYQGELEEVETEQGEPDDDRTNPEIEIISAEPIEMEEPRPIVCTPEQDEYEELEIAFELDDEQPILDVELGSSDPDEVVIRVRERLQEDPRHARSYRMLRAIFTDREQYDRAWCVCAVMTYLGCASESERLYYETYKPRCVAQGGESLSRELWDRVVHPAAEDPRVAVIARVFGSELSRLRARPLRHHGFSPRDRRDSNNDQLALSRALERAADLLHVPLPDLYLEPDEPGELSLENVVHRGKLSPSLVARGDALRGRTPGELACIAGHALAFLRSDFFLMVALPTEAELRATWEAALDLAHPAGKGRRGTEPSPDSTRATLEKALSSRVRAELALAVNGSGLAFGRLDIGAWRSAVEITAQRIGLIMCGDPAISARTLAGEVAPTSASTRQTEIDQLLLFAVSDDYFAVRTHLGGVIGAATSSADCHARRV